MMDRAEYLALNLRRRDLVKAYDRIMPESTGWPSYGWDWPTLHMVYPEKVGWIRDILLAIDLKDGYAG